MSPPRSDPAADFAALRDDLGELAGLVLAQVERAVAGWGESDAGVAELVSATDRVRLPPAGDLRLLHVGLIVAVALERVGNLAVQIARLAGSVPPPAPELDAVSGLIAQMGERAVDAMAQAVQAVARGEVDAGERAVSDARSVSPMLDRVLQAVTRAPSGPTMRAWSAAAVLVARHVERVADNAAEIGARVRFLVTGETAPLDLAPRDG